MISIRRREQQSSAGTAIPRSAAHTRITWDRTAVAALSPSQIAELSTQELARAILAAKLPLLRTDTVAELELYDRCTLERLAHLARRCCRNQGY